MSKTYEDILNHKLDDYRSKEAEEIKEFLTYIDEIELDHHEWEFHLLRVYVRKSDGMILWATDGGCSCPTPFENTKVKDLCESSVETFMGAVEGSLRSGDAPYSENRSDALELLAEAILAGAR